MCFQKNSNKVKSIFFLLLMLSIYCRLHLHSLHNLEEDVRRHGTAPDTLAPPTTLLFRRCLHSKAHTQGPLVRAIDTTTREFALGKRSRRHFPQHGLSLPIVWEKLPLLISLPSSAVPLLFPPHYSATGSRGRGGGARPPLYSNPNPPFGRLSGWGWMGEGEPPHHLERKQFMFKNLSK